MAGVNRMSMMEQVHLAGEDEDDIYGGFNDYNATLDTDVSSFIVKHTDVFRVLDEFEAA